MIVEEAPRAVDMQTTRATRIAIIGNSHVAALKVGWDPIANDHPGVSLHFIGSPAQSIADAYLDGVVLKGRSKLVRNGFLRTAGAEEVDLGDFDKIWIIGAGVRIRSIARLFMSARVHASGNAQSGEKAKGLEALDLVSQPLMVAMVRQMMSQTAARHLVDMCRASLKADVYVMPEPHISERILDGANRRGLKWIKEHGLAELVAEVFEEGYRQAFDGRATPVSQPADTIVNFMFTDDRYAAGSVRPNTMNDEITSDLSDDVTHKNDAYGRRVIERLMEASGLAGGAPLVARPAD